MKIKVAEHSGFCFGVQRAIEAVERELERTGEVYIYGEIIHNKQVVEQLKNKGAHPVETLEAVPPASVIVIRSHGVPKAFYAEAAARSIKIVDATCPFVKRIHSIVSANTALGREIIIAGHKDHPEVLGINGWCENGAHIVTAIDDCKLLPAMQNACLVAQTTLPKEQFELIRAELEAKIPNLEVFGTICSTTLERQDEAKRLALECDAIIVVGGRSSANTTKLYEISKKYCSRVVIIEKADEVSIENYFADDIIGVVAGASTPDWMIREVITTMSELDKPVGELEMENSETVTASPDMGEPKAEIETEPKGETNNSEATAEAVQPEETEVASAAQDSEPVEATSAEVEEQAPAASEQEADAPGDDSFASAFEKTMVRIHGGQLLKGTVVQISADEVCVNIGYKSDGIIPKSEFSALGDVDPSQELNIGDEIEVEVLKVNDGEGNVLLSRKSIESKKLWDDFIAGMDESKEYEGIGKEAVKGGLVAAINGVRTFIPASQLSNKYVEDISDFVGKPLRLKIIEVDKARKRIVASQKLVLAGDAELEKKKLWETLNEGDTVKGVVRRLTDFGAFVDIGGIDGLVHVTNIAWGRVKHPGDVLSVSQEIEAKILSVDTDKSRVSLGIKQLLPKPWTLAPEKYLVGSIIEGKVVRIVPFGAFVALEPSIDGLVHISQVSLGRIAKVEDALNIGDVIRAKVLEVNPETKRISLSIKDAIIEEDPEQVEKFEQERAEMLAQRAAERDTEKPERSERPQRSMRQDRPRSDRPARERTPREDHSYELPAVVQATTSLADFFPKEALLSEEPAAEPVVKEAKAAPAKKAAKATEAVEATETPLEAEATAEATVAEEAPVAEAEAAAPKKPAAKKTTAAKTTTKKAAAKPAEDAEAEAAPKKPAAKKTTAAKAEGAAKTTKATKKETE